MVETCAIVTTERMAIPLMKFYMNFNFNQTMFVSSLSYIILISTTFCLIHKQCDCLGVCKNISVIVSALSFWLSKYDVENFHWRWNSIKIGRCLGIHYRKPSLKCRMYSVWWSVMNLDLYSIYQFNWLLCIWKKSFSHYSNMTWVSMCLKPPTTWLFIQ